MLQLTNGTGTKHAQSDTQLHAVMEIHVLRILMPEQYSHSDHI